MRYQLQLTPDSWAFDNQGLPCKSVPEAMWGSHQKSADDLSTALGWFEDWKFDFNHVRVLDKETGVRYYPEW